MCIKRSLAVLLGAVVLAVSFTACVFNLENFGGEEDASGPRQTLGEFVDELPEVLGDHVDDVLPGNSEGTGSGPGGADPEYGGLDASLKLPVPKGYSWEITQSWKEHCETCNQRGYDLVYGDYCSGSDSTHLYDCCHKAWDFNLPGDGDLGKPVLAVGDGVVEHSGWDGSWGETVVQNLGQNVCARYSHLVENSNSHLKFGDTICQGLKIGEIGGTPNWSTHLHFQFETCDTKEPLAMGFTDGNGVPECRIGDDVFDSNGDYDFLLLTNDMKTSCDSGGSDSGGNNSGGSNSGGSDPDDEGWIVVGCGSIPGCPLNPNCDRQFGHEFTDQFMLDAETIAAADYLWRECALNGKADGGLHPDDVPTRAETLKLSMYLFGLIHDCDGGETEDFVDVWPSDWFRDVVACGVDQGIVSAEHDFFRPNEEITFPELAKVLVESGVSKGTITLAYNSTDQHFPNIDRDQWAFPYVETLYHYGALTRHTGNYRMDSKIPRDELVQMAAGLSPCFCDNVICDGGCQCNQEVMACQDPDSSSGPEYGGGLDIYDDISIACWMTSYSHCQGGAGFLDVKCSLENESDEDLSYNNLEMVVDDPDCMVLEDQLRSGDSVIQIAPGEVEELTGNFLVQCDQEPQGGLFYPDFNLSVEVNGSLDWFNDVTSTGVRVDTSVLTCLDPNATSGYVVEPDPSINCGVDSGTSVTIHLPGGRVTGQSLAANSYFSEDVGSSDMHLDYECEDLPVWLFLEDGTDQMIVTQQNSTHEMSIWIGYPWFQTEPPSLPPNRTQVDLDRPAQKTLIRIPALP